MELSETLMSCKCCGIGRLKTVPVQRWKHASWHQSVSTQIFLLLQHTFSSLDSFSYQQSQPNITGYSDDSSWCPGRFPCLCYYSQINSFRKRIQFILEQSKRIFWKAQNRWATFFAKKKKKKEKKKSPIVIWLVKLQVNTQRRFRKNIKDNITLVLIA